MGLLRQHLTCLRAAMEICNAEVMGDELESRSVVFIPGEIKAGDYHFVTGSAGSTCLVFQTVLMPLLMAKGVSEIFFEGVLIMERRRELILSNIVFCQ